MKDEVKASLDTLGTRLRKVEKELDLECLNLRDLVNSRDPQINRQLDALSGSISELHTSLAEVRSHLETAAADGKEIAAATKEAETSAAAAGTVKATPPKDLVEKLESPSQELSPAEIGRIRHDEEITFSGIVRALFMADEPQQRSNKEE